MMRKLPGLPILRSTVMRFTCACRMMEMLCCIRVRMTMLRLFGLATLCKRLRRRRRRNKQIN